MSRSGYVDDFDLDPLDHGRYRAQVASAIRGRRGQRFLRDLVEYLDGMPEKKLVQGAFQIDGGGCCAAGAVGRKRGVDLADLNPSEDDLDCEYGNFESRWNRAAAKRLDVAVQLISEVESVNDDDGFFGEDDEEKRWRRVRAWALRRLSKESALELRGRGIDTSY